MAAEQLGLEGMPKPLRQVTPAKVETFDSCPRRFRYIYVDRPSPPRGAPWAHTGIGAAVHSALRGYWDVPPERRGPDGVVADLRLMWPQAGFRDAAQSQRALEISSDQVGRYVDEHLDPEDEPRGIERTVGAPYVDLSISGRVDRVDEIETDDGRALVVVDYKTGRAQPTEDDARTSMQLAMYAVAAERTLRAPVERVELHHIPTSTIAGVDLSTETRHRQLRRAAYTADDIDRAKTDLAEGAAPDVAYPARPSLACGWCDFWAHCPEGKAATQLRDPWFAVPGEDSRHQ